MLTYRGCRWHLRIHPGSGLCRRRGSEALEYSQNSRVDLSGRVSPPLAPAPERYRPAAPLIAPAHSQPSLRLILLAPVFGTDNASDDDTRTVTVMLAGGAVIRAFGGVLVTDFPLIKFFS